MPRIRNKADKVIVDYCRPSGGERRSFALCLTHLNGYEAAFTLVAERRPSGAWKPLRAAVDVDETDADPDEVARDLADLRWYIFPARERGRVLPPVIAVWEEGDLVVAACLSDRYGGKRLPYAEQERWSGSDAEGEAPDPGRFLCWWPDPEAWDASKEAAEHLKLVPVKEIAVNFFPFGEWFKRADVIREMEEYRTELEEAEDDPELLAEVLADIRAEEYARYLRRVRTMLLYCRERNISAKVVVGDVRRAEAFFKEKGLDALEPPAWAAASAVFEPMPDFLIEELGFCGPLGVAASGQKLKAALSLISHLPGVAPAPDAVGAVVHAGTRHVASLVAWVNPLGGWEAVEGAVDALVEELSRRGVKEMTMIDGLLPFEACPCCGRLSLRVPDDWLRPEPVRAKKVGRNEPCPCGSGLKYKKCCGRSF
ncbi:SEC-C motif-containing protein [Thermanaeromonas toyohensis ToBE]|uniref:SEC-C motif-containing protein n=1 Tax=Thermanaeromonas toyohensis ToBE TaxID=698762 RepID=A0A1W1VRY4_9FIRM|nr:SEC-C motif-containing protein [Thermanaeromonas toyohensis ToBE]